MGNFIAKSIKVIIFTLLIFVGIYFIMSLFEFVPDIGKVWDHSKYLEEDSILYNKELYQYYDFIKFILFLFIPIGFALFVAPWEENDAIVWNVLSLVGFALMIVPTLIFHIQLMNFEPIPNAGVGSSTMQDPHTGLFFIFPLTCLFVTVSFHTIGYNQFLNDWDTSKTNLLAYLYVLGGAILLMLLCVSLFSLSLESFGILTVVIGCISLAVLGISRMKNGSPFAY